ncbi:hypothetical protein R3P38DRAFT_2812170 [Favolaschia claudopus]|uniref:Uncharacterized protein n=1 Tax=Favolaschia claudopus TaxID=2862362 RepID=A0AAV9Z7I2_9AGAR
MNLLISKLAGWGAVEPRNGGKDEKVRGNGNGIDGSGPKSQGRITLGRRQGSDTEREDTTAEWSLNSLDGKEAAYFAACRAALANYPCPKCLVSKVDLHRITGGFRLRTSKTMKAVVVKAFSSRTKKEKEDLLKSYGLHGIMHFLWEYRFSDPYLAYLYDTLHSDNLGGWGHHLWPLLLEVLESLKQKGPLAETTFFLALFNCYLQMTPLFTAYERISVAESLLA